MGEKERQIDLVAAAKSLPREREEHLRKLLNGGLFLSHTSVDAPFIRQHIEPVAVAEFYGAFFFQNQSFPMSQAYEPLVGQALLACRVMLVVVSAAAVGSRYMKAELDVAANKKMPTIICRRDQTHPLEVSPSLGAGFRLWRRRALADVDFSAAPELAAERLKKVLRDRSFRCTHALFL